MVNFKNLDEGAISRRAFLKAAGLSTAALAMGPVSTAVARDWGGGGGSWGGGGTITRNPLRIPPVVSPANLNLSAAPGTADLGGGSFSNVLAYNSLFPGPTLLASRGDSVRAYFTNGLSEETTVHWHGMVVPTAMDGQPQDVIAAGGNYLYQYPIIQRACLNWYHPHPHELTGKQVNLGLAGGFIVRDAEEAALGLPSGAYEIPLIVRDAEFDRNGNLEYDQSWGTFEGNIALVNGTLDPKLDVDTAVYRFRVLSGANARLFKFKLSNGAPMTLIGNDGGLLETAVNVSQIEIGSGERLDILVDFRGLAVGTKVLLQDANEPWDLLEFNVARQVTDNRIIPSQLSTISHLSNPVTTRTWEFSGMSKINGLEFDPIRIDARVPFGQTERWRFIAGRSTPHVIHVHGASYQVQSRTGGRGQVFPWERGWKDNVLLKDGETVDVLVRFDGYKGRYPIHCHILEHEDSGMMTNFEVI